MKWWRQEVPACRRTIKGQMMSDKTVSQSEWYAQHFFRTVPYLNAHQLCLVGVMFWKGLWHCKRAACIIKSVLDSFVLSLTQVTHYFCQHWKTICNVFFFWQNQRVFHPFWSITWYCIVKTEPYQSPWERQQQTILEGFPSSVCVLDLVLGPVCLSPHFSVEGRSTMRHFITQSNVYRLGRWQQWIEVVAQFHVRDVVAGHARITKPAIMSKEVTSDTPMWL